MLHGKPLQCSCLENPRDGRAWWAAVSGVAQSRTRVKLRQQQQQCLCICCCCSVAKSNLTLCDHKDYSVPEFPVFHYLLE